MGKKLVCVMCGLDWGVSALVRVREREYICPACRRGFRWKGPWNGSLEAGREPRPCRPP